MQFVDQRRKHQEKKNQLPTKGEKKQYNIDKREKMEKHQGNGNNKKTMYKNR